MLRLWGVTAIAATAGWLTAVLALIVGVRPVGWVLVGAAAVTVLTTAGVCRGRGTRHPGSAGVTFACIMVGWPILALVTLVIVSLADPGLTGQ